MLEVYTHVVPAPDGRPQKVYATITAGQEELTALRDAIDHALHGQPGTSCDARTTNGMDFHISIDRLGPPLPGN